VGLQEENGCQTNEFHGWALPLTQPRHAHIDGAESARGIEMATNKNWSGWRPQTLAVRGAQHRTEFQETSEALFLTSGYAYEGPEEAEERFKGAPGYTYTRYGNPTTSIFEERMALLEGAPFGRATASGMAAVSASLLC
jgi:O-succinylhomoserine sulfhydrylase